MTETCRVSQLELKQCIDSLAEELKKVSEAQQHTVDLEVYLKKLINAKQRVSVLSNILQVFMLCNNVMHHC